MMEEQKERDEKAAEHKATVQKYFNDEQLKLRQVTPPPHTHTHTHSAERGPTAPC